MKAFLVLALSLSASFPAFATPVVRCLNPATGAVMSIDPYHPRGSGMPITAILTMNEALHASLSYQAKGSVDNSPIGRATLVSGGVQFTTLDGQYVRFEPEGNGFRLLVHLQSRPANFFFNAGECRWN